MRKLWLFIVTLVAIGLLAGTSWAGHVSISGTHSANEIRSTCNRTGGSFTEGGGVYGCTKNCGNDVCSVTCVGGKCTGNCPKCGQRERRLPTLGGTDAADRILRDSVQRRSNRY
jgi:hypothetical protein